MRQRGVSGLLMRICQGRSCDCEVVHQQDKEAKIQLPAEIYEHTVVPFSGLRRLRKHF